MQFCTTQRLTGATGVHKKATAVTSSYKKGATSPRPPHNNTHAAGRESQKAANSNGKIPVSQSLQSLDRQIQANTHSRKWQALNLVAQSSEEPVAEICRESDEEEEDDDDAVVVEERPLREIISMSSKLSPVKKDLTFDKHEMRLLKLGTINSIEKSAEDSLLDTKTKKSCSQLVNLSMTLSGMRNNLPMKEIKGDNEVKNLEGGRKMIKIGDKPA